LRIFVAAAEEENFSRAAEKLHLSQPAVSQAIRTFEQALGTELFLRHGRSVRLSAAGEVLLPMAREALDSILRIEDTMTGIQGEVLGELAIGCTTSSGKYLLPVLGAHFRELYPHVRFQVQVRGRADVKERLLDERLKIGVFSSKLESRNLEYQPFFEDRVILIVPKDHRWADYGRALPSDLIDEPMIMREPSAGTTEVLFEALSDQGIDPDSLNIIMELGNAEAIETAVEQGIGVAFISKLAAARGLELGRVKEVAVEGMDLRRMIYLVRNPKSSFTRAQDRFWDFVTEQRVNLEAQVWGRQDLPALDSLEIPRVYDEAKALS
jgi:DNA-binding transcriptional LysR family regulator